MNPPTCRSCGKAEWRHICKGPAAPLAMRGRETKRPKRETKAVKRGTKPKKPGVYTTPRIKEGF